ncbi:MAG: FAD-dependent oxidoreductase [Verrucomicrobiae bacterium]|nr:FAD-dependent oxidoreductase [Verrucomicrobiae bacterium]
MPKRKTLDLEIAILGGGFAGVYCGKSLLRTLARGSRTRIGLISDENYMVFQPMLPEVASASISPRHVVNPIRHLCKGLEIYKAEVESINIKDKQLTLRPGPFSPPVLVRFQHLVVALGAKVDLRRVPGMPEHSFLMQNVGDAMKLRSTVLARFEEANLVTDPERRRRLLTFVVVGGGYSGVETAGQILDLFQAINKYYGNVGPEDFHVHLVHSRDHLLPTLSLSLGKYAEEKLRKRGLNISLERRVKALTANQVLLDDGTVIETNTVVSTVGNAPHPLVTQLIQDAGVEAVHGRIKTTDTMQVTGYDWLWSAGDCAAVPMPNGEICPSTAQFAMRQGERLGKNLNAFLRTEKVKPFTFKGLGELAAIGHMTAVAEIMGMRFSGFIAWWMWRTVYLMKLPGLDRKLRVLIDWTLDLFFPRDINLLSPRYTHALQESHLEKGDVLFKAGDPAFSFYIVKKGSIQLSDENGEVVKTVSTGDFFGERALLSDQTWQFTATASEDTLLIGLASEEFKVLMENSRLMRHMLERSAKQYRSSKEIDMMMDTLPPELLQKSADSLMTRDMVKLKTTDSVTDTLQRFNKERHSFYPVVEGDKETFCGVLARDDFYDFVQAHGLDENASLQACNFCELPSTSVDTTVQDCLEMMIRGGRNKLLILGEGNQLQGILSIRDVLAAGAQTSARTGK